MELPNFQISTTKMETGQQQERNEALKTAAQELETSFLAEMLRSAGVGKVSQDWGGGAGEEHFASFLVNIHAEKIVERGGIGIASQIYSKLKGME